MPWTFTFCYRWCGAVNPVSAGWARTARTAMSVHRLSKFADLVRCDIDWSPTPYGRKFKIPLQVRKLFDLTRKDCRFGDVVLAARHTRSPVLGVARAGMLDLTIPRSPIRRLANRDVPPPSLPEQALRRPRRIAQMLVQGSTGRAFV